MSSELRRDPWGVPHVVADDPVELAWAQGRVTALDRAWQLEHGRLEAEGRTASVLGAEGLPWDRLARRLQLEQLGRRAYGALPAETAAFVDAYVEGVNDGLAGVGQVAELAALEAAPGRWSAWTPLAVFAARHVLFATFPDKLWREHVERRGPAGLPGLLDAEGLGASGSNSWVVGGDRTASGRPMVGGDPHRSFEAPNVYQQVRLTCTGDTGFDVVGFTFPGVPGVQHFAHAGTVAWGITNAMADYQDVYLERLERRGDQVWAEGPDGWRPAARHVETIEVRGAADEQVEVVVTANGPVVSGGPEGPAYSLRTASYALDDLGFSCLLPLLRSRTAADVCAALEGWVEPVNNLVVADVHGDARQGVVGRVPQRDERNRRYPVPGWVAAHRWTGWVTPLPSQAVPSDGHLVTANHRMNEDFDRVGVDFAPPGRAHRIEALLRGRGDLTADDFAAIHRDVLAGQPAALAAAVAGLSGLSESGAALQRELVEWDQRFPHDSRTAAAYVAVRDSLVLRLATVAPFAGLGEVAGHEAVLDPWFDLPRRLQLGLANLFTTAGRALVPCTGDLLRAAVEEVAADRPGPWGPRHRFEPVHVLGFALDERPGLAGDEDCVRCTGAVPGSQVAHRGSVARYAWDLGGLDRSGWVVPLGASGDPDSPHHHDQTAAWTEGRLLPLPGSPTVAGPVVST